MKKRFSKGLALVVAALFITSGMVAVAKVKKPTNLANTKKTLSTHSAHRVGASGHSGREIELGKKNSYLHTIEWSERHDKPCWMALKGTEVIKGDPKGWTQEGKTCAKKDGSFRRMYFSNPNDDLIRAISGVQVCTSEKKSSDDERLKGIRIFSSTIDRKTGKVLKEGETEDDRRPNCKTWHEEVHCPTGEIATKLLVNKGTTGKGHDCFVGIGLECSKVKMK